MRMIVLAVEFHQLSIKILAHAGQDRLHGLQMLFLEHVAPILGYEYQVNMKSEYTMPTVAKIAI